MINWTNDNEFHVNGTKFTIDLTPGYKRRKSTSNNFTLVKTRKFLSIYEKLAGKIKSDNLLEFGIFQGGSMALMVEMFKPKKVMGIELSKIRIDALDEYLDSRPIHKNILYGRSQSDPKLVGEFKAYFSDGIDLIVDDASHLYEHSKQSLINSWPLLKPGGTYILEDWSWNFRKAHQNPNHNWYDKPGLSNIIIELFEDVATNNAIESVNIYNELIVITKTGVKNAELFGNNYKYRRNRSIGLI